jgi:hypothetical protein
MSESHLGFIDCDRACIAWYKPTRSKWKSEIRGGHRVAGVLNLYRRQVCGKKEKWEG